MTVSDSGEGGEKEDEEPKVTCVDEEEAEYIMQNFSENSGASSCCKCGAKKCKCRFVALESTRVFVCHSEDGCIPVGNPVIPAEPESCI